MTDLEITRLHIPAGWVAEGDPRGIVVEYPGKGWVTLDLSDRIRNWALGCVTVRRYQPKSIIDWRKGKGWKKDMVVEACAHLRAAVEDHIGG